MESRMIVPGFEGYAADSEGLIYRDGEILHATIDENGYRKVASGRSGHIKAATLVCLAFHGPKPSSRHLVAHYEDVPYNDKPSNLRWATYVGNADDRDRNGNTARGELNGTSKLVPSEVREIRALYAEGDRTQQSLAYEFGVCQRSINLIVRGLTWTHI